jgi:hypothetical protein
MMKKLILAVVDLLCKIHLLSPLKVAKLKFYYKFHRWPNFEHPQDLNEKMNWMKFYGDTSMWPDLADKYKVRDYVEKKGLGNTLVKLYGKWDNPKDIDWSILPNQFVIKANNGSGDVIVCRDKSKINKAEIISYFQKILSKTYGIDSGEPHYAKIKPCVVVEELLDASTQGVKSSSLIDYKIWCFNGVPKYIWTCYNRTKEGTEVSMFDTEWNFHPEYSIYTHHYSEAKQLVPKPICLDEMLRVASILSENIPILRCDLYEVNGKVYFGEMTFTSLGGFMDFYTKDFLDKAGKMITLPFEK